MWIGAVALLLLLPSAAALSQGAAQDSGVTGLWSYETLTTAKGPTSSPSGSFLFKDGYFVQEALNDGEPFDQQFLQAHAGTYTVGASVQLVAEVQLAVTPTRTPAVSSSPGRAHQITPTRKGDRLTLTFGSGTVQTLRRVGAGEGDVVLLDRGALALVDGRFLLVFENGARQIVGAGRAERRGSQLALLADRWMTARDGQARYQRHVEIDAVLEGGELRVPGEAPMRVRPASQLSPTGLSVGNFSRWSSWPCGNAAEGVDPNCSGHDPPAH
jgi:hypothetical protein